MLVNHTTPLTLLGSYHVERDTTPFCFVTSLSDTSLSLLGDASYWNSCHQGTYSSLSIPVFPQPYSHLTFGACSVCPEIFHISYLLCSWNALHLSLSPLLGLSLPLLLAAGVWIPWTLSRPLAFSNLLSTDSPSSLKPYCLIAKDLASV